MKNTVKLSVIISNYNQIDYIEDAVESVLNLEMDEPFEVIIGDDGSTDGSYELLMEKYADRENVTIYQMTRDFPSVSAVGNVRHVNMMWRGVEQAKGEYLICLDGDDYFFDESVVKEKIRILDKPENQDCVACASQMVKNFDGEFKKCSFPNDSHKYTLHDLFYGKCNGRYWFHLETCVFRRSVLEHADFSQPLRLGDDQGTLYFILHYGKLYYLPKADISYRVIGTSMVHRLNIVEECLRYSIGCNMRLHFYPDHHAKIIWKAGRHITGLYRHREEVSTIKRWDYCKDYIEQNDLFMVKWLLGMETPAKVKRKMPFVMIWSKMGEIADKSRHLQVYIEESVAFLFDKEVSSQEKRDRILSKFSGKKG